MDFLGLETASSFRILKTIITATISAASIGWWSWIAYSTLGQLRNNQISFIELIIEVFRALATTLGILTIISFL